MYYIKRKLYEADGSLVAEYGKRCVTPEAIPESHWEEIKQASQNFTVQEDDEGILQRVYENTRYWGELEIS